MEFVQEFFAALQPVMPFLVSGLTMYAMKGLKRLSTKVAALPDTQKRIVVLVLSALLTATGKALGVETPTEIDMLAAGSVSQIITAALASMGLYQVTKPKATA